MVSWIALGLGSRVSDKARGVDQSLGWGKNKEIDKENWRFVSV